MSEIINNQRKFKLDWKRFQEFSEKVIKLIPETEKRTANIAFVSVGKMRELNGQFRGKNTITDVLSFPFQADEFDSDEDFLGDIVISLEQAERQSKENDLPLETEIKQLILHGILHLCGYDHETDSGEMNQIELEYRDKLQIN